MPPAKYIHRPTPVVAIRYDGSNDREVERFLGPMAIPAELAVAGEKVLTMQTSAGPVQLTPGCWVLRDEKDQYSALTPAQFEALYQPAGDTPPPATRLRPVEPAPAAEEEEEPRPPIPFDVEVEDLLAARIEEAGENPVVLGDLLAALTRLRDTLEEQQTALGEKVKGARQLARAR